MHYKKRKLHKLHSIPIGLCNRVCSLILQEHSNLSAKRLYLVSYSIPLSCMVVLLLGLGLMINPGLFLVDKSSAVTIQDEWVVKDSNSSSSSNSDYRSPASVKGENNNSNSNASTTSEASNNININSSDDSFGGFGGDEVELLQEDIDAGIAPMSLIPSPTLAITVSNTGQEINAAQGGNTVYGSYNVGMTGSNVKDYTLSIKASSTNLTMPSGASSSTSTISGAGGKTGDSMNANTWGYKLTETSTAESSYGTLNYASLPTTLTQIANGTVASPYNLSTNKKLVFAAKFSDTAAPGTYKGHITLSAVANQAVVGAIWSNGLETNITDMQDIGSGFCKDNSNIPTGTTITLIDKRTNGGSIPYKIVKLKDGQCWMQENLKLGGSSAMNLTSSDTDLASGTSSWQLPASSDSSWSSSDTLAQIRVGKSGMTVSSSYPGDGKGWQSNYGNYYSWCAATAGSCSSATSSGAVAGGSICPKNWHLPTGNTNGEFYNVLNGLNFTTVQQSPYLFPATGSISTGGLRDPGTNGYYWSSTASSVTGAYYLDFYSSNFYPGTYTVSRYVGYSVRCVADY